MISEGQFGNTFVEWSVYFLSNKSTYFSWPKCQWVTLVKNPFNGLNAHKHPKNYPWGADSTRDFFDAVDRQNDFGLYSSYPHQLMLQTIAKKINVDINKISEKSVYTKILEYDRRETIRMVDLCFERSSHLVYLEYKSQAMPLIYFFPRALATKFTNLSKPKDENELLDEQDQLWNESDINAWNDLYLTDIWDRRERLALNIRPIGKPGIDCVSDVFDRINFSRKHHRIGVRDLWCRGDQTFITLMEYLDLPIDAGQWKKWQPIYQQWAAPQLRILGFMDNLSYVLEAIVNDWYYQLPELTFRQEVLIQHFLIYQYNLNLKTWQLNKFPSNTRDLHVLLEPNIHGTSLLY